MTGRAPARDCASQPLQTGSSGGPAWPADPLRGMIQRAPTYAVCCVTGHRAPAWSWHHSCYQSAQVSALSCGPAWPADLLFGTNGRARAHVARGVTDHHTPAWDWRHSCYISAQVSAPSCDPAWDKQQVPRIGGTLRDWSLRPCVGQAS